MNGDLLQILWRVLLVLGLVVFNGFFVAAEFALIRIRETQLDALVVKGHRRAKEIGELGCRLINLRSGIAL